MPATGLEQFDTTVQKTNIWLTDIMEQQGWEDRNRAYLALRGVLHALRDRLTPEEAAHFAAELPVLLRGIFYEGWSPSGKPIKMDRKDFFSDVSKVFQDDPPLDPEQVTRTVFSVLEKHISEGEISDIRNILPGEIRNLWERRLSP